jgi:hypothetical protein
MEKEDEAKTLDEKKIENLATFYNEELHTQTQLANYRFGGGEQHLDQDTDYVILYNHTKMSSFH